MTAPARSEPLAYTVDSLARRWQCSPSMVRKLIDRGELAHFRIGTAIRIRAVEVERFECQDTQFSGSGEDMPLSGESRASDAAALYTPQIGRARKPKRAAYGKAATIHHGPWAGS